MLKGNVYILVEGLLFRLLSAGDSLFKTPPTEEEKSLIHDFFIKTVRIIENAWQRKFKQSLFLSKLDKKALSFKARVKPVNHVWMEDTKLKNLVICQPEYRNRFNKIFGGFIMRQVRQLCKA